MTPPKKYDCIEFNGLWLHPSFSIYLFEIIKDGGERFFYVGMTGDRHYPSARSILHRLAGHINLSDLSTQSQFIKGLKTKVFKKHDLTANDLMALHVKLHHWLIKGFKPWGKPLKKFKKEELEAGDKIKYEGYSKKQKAVQKIENSIIKYLVEDAKVNCLNEKMTGSGELPGAYNYIKSEIEAIIQK